VAVSAGDAPASSLGALPASTAPTSSLSAIPAQAAQNAISAGARAVTDLDAGALSDLPEQTLNDLEASARQAAAGVVDEATAPITEVAVEAERKVGERIQNVTSNAASRVRGFFTRNRKRDEEQSAEED
jgi:hypothetical protein